ncbi:MAG: hypothetical protein IKZ10_00490 [Akkermansia sp.]|nr:hypothetical protein [Akkermansia sp.]
MNLKLYTALFVIASLLPSCVYLTSAAMVESAAFYAKEADDEAVQFFMLNGQYYARCKVQYVVERERVKVGYEVPVREIYLPFGYKREREPEVVYALMSPDVVKRCLGKRVAEPAPEVPRLIAEEDWDAAAALPCAATGGKEWRVGWCTVAADRMREGCVSYMERARANELGIQMPYSYSWDAAVKYPLAALMFVGIDVPCTVVSNVAVGAFIITAWPFVGCQVKEDNSTAQQPLILSE